MAKKNIVHNGKYKQRCKQIIMIDELVKELGLGINEEHDNAVLYSVMLRFLKKKAKEYNMEMDSLFLQVTEEDGTIDLYEHSHDCENPPIFIDETKPNEA